MYKRSPTSCSLKDDDSGDHDQNEDSGSPKECEKEESDEEDKEQNTAKKKVCVWWGW